VAKRIGFGYDIGALKDESNPVAQAYFAIFKNSPETLLTTLLVALYPILEYLPFSWIQRRNVARKVIINAATEIVTTALEKGSQKDQKDILGCMLHETRRLEMMGEEGLSTKEMIQQILTFLVAGYFQSFIMLIKS
jgi:cytochrome P450